MRLMKSSRLFIYLRLSVSPHVSVHLSVYIQIFKEYETYEITMLSGYPLYYLLFTFELLMLYFQ
jgi:hypothetical protein